MEIMYVVMSGHPHHLEFPAVTETVVRMSKEIGP